MEVLSLFDGMSCGLQALKQAGIKVDNYYASEVDKYAIQIAKKNHPEIQHLGDVNGWDSWELPEIDLIIGGSPCQGFSFAGKQLNFDDPRSALFFKFVDCIRKFKPKHFLLENVKMKKEYQDAISEMLGVEPILINSALVSAQNRKRLYWCNWEVEQPEDRGILLKDVIEGGANQLHQRGRGNNSGGLRENKSPSMGSSSWEHNVHVVDRKKAHCIDANYFKGGNLKSYFEKHRRQLVFELGQYSEKCKKQILKNAKTAHEKSIALCSNSNVTGSGVTPLDMMNGKYRKLTPIECERLQTLPDGYTDGVSNTQRYKMIGNGWTVAVIEHIFKNIYGRGE